MPIEDRELKKLTVMFEMLLKEAKASGEDPVTISLDQETVDLALNILAEARARTKRKEKDTA